MSNLKKRIFSQVSSVSIGAGSIVSFISDFLVPIAPFALWIGLFSLSIISLLTVYRLVLPSSKPSDDYDGIWYAPLAISTLLFSIICLSTYYISIQYKNLNGTDSGFLSSNIKIVEVLQKNALSLSDIKEIQLKSLDENIKTNNTLEDSKKIHIKSLDEQIKINDILKNSNEQLKSSLKQQQKTNKILETSNDNLLKSIDEQKKVNEKLKESNLLQRNISSNSSSNLKSTKNIEHATYFSFTSLREALISGDLEKLENFNKHGKSLTLVNQSASEYSAPMIIEMIKKNHNNPDEILEFLISKNALDTHKLFNINVNAPLGYRSFWQLFIERTKEVDLYITEGISFEKMQEDFRKKYGYVFPDKLKKKYINTTPTGARKLGKKQKKYYFSGAWLNNNALSINVSLYSAALISHNDKARKLLEKLDSKEIGYYLMPSGVKILLDPDFINLN